MMKRKKGRVPKLSAIVLLFLGVMAAMFLMRTYSAQGAFVGEKAKKMVDTVKYFTTQCAFFAELDKKICVHPDLKLSGLNGDMGVVIKNFWVMAAFSDKKIIPKTL